MGLEDKTEKEAKENTVEKILKDFIVNTYTTILARGIKGCYIYACDSNMKKYLNQYITTANEFTLKEE